MKLQELIVIFIFVCWGIMSILCQFKIKRISRIRYWDIFHFFPTWTFFAPKPLTHDFHILFRNKYFDNSIGTWHEIQINNKRWLCFLWNPKKREQKSFSDSVMLLLQAYTKLYTKKLKKNKIYFSVWYINLCTFMSLSDLDNISSARQFCIVKTGGHDLESENKILFVSKFHRLDYGV